MTARMFFTHAESFRQWLDANASHAAKLLVGFHKVGTGQPSMTWSQSVDEALCLGWIDGVRKRIDDGTYSIRFTPRKPGSTWSAINIAKVAQLQAEGRMTPAGYEKVVLHWVTSAKKPETRFAQLSKLLEACADGKRLKQFSY